MKVVKIFILLSIGEGILNGMDSAYNIRGRCEN